MAVAALGHLHVGPRGRGLGAGEVEQVQLGPVPGGSPLRRQRDGNAEAGDGVSLRKGVSELLAVALGHAAGDDEAGARPAGVAQGQDGLDRLLSGGLDEGAGVDNHDVGLVGGCRRHQTVGDQRAHELVGIDLVLRAAERLDPKRLLGHSIKSTGGLPFPHERSDRDDQPDDGPDHRHGARHGGIAGTTSGAARPQRISHLGPARLRRAPRAASARPRPAPRPHRRGGRSRVRGDGQDALRVDLHRSLRHR